MNKPKALLLAIALLVMVLSLSATEKNEGVSAVKSKHNSLFVLKADREFVGATVEVLSSKGDLITSSTLGRRKMVIDFKAVEQGSYTVRLTKGAEVRQFNYLNI
jgi:hypothetical protein